MGSWNSHVYLDTLFVYWEYCTMIHFSFGVDCAKVVWHRFIIKLNGKSRQLNGIYSVQDACKLFWWKGFLFGLTFLIGLFRYLFGCWDCNMISIFVDCAKVVWDKFIYSIISQQNKDNQIQYIAYKTLISFVGDKGFCLDLFF